MRTHISVSFAPFTLIALGAMVTACKNPDTKDVDAEVCVPVPGEACPEEGSATSEDAGDDDVGGTEDTSGEEPVPLGSDECRHNHDDYNPVVGYQYQCEGDLHTSLSFTVKGEGCGDLLDGWCAQDYAFGVNFQSYAAAEVIACCGEYDYQYASTYKEFCAYDMYQQVCISLAERLQAAINAGNFGGYGDEAAMIQVWIANHYADCFSALLANNSEELPDVVSHWALGTFGDLENVVLSIDAPTRIHGVNLPADENEWIICDDANGNNDQVLEDAHEPDNDIIIDINPATDIDIDMHGPLVFGGQVSASASLDASCGPRGCPSAELSRSRTGDGFALEEFDHFEDDPVEVSNGIYSVTIDRLQIRLWSRAIGSRVVDPSGAVLGYVIPSGAAQFMISGLNADLGANRFMAVSTSDIWISDSGVGWSIDEFEIGFIDANLDDWTISIGKSQWLE